MMKWVTLFTIIFVLAVNPINLFGQFSLTIVINGLINSKGQVLLELSNEKSERISGIIKNIENNKCIIVINNLKPGKYAFKYFHDENKNGVLDLSWIGIPKEGFGFANNAKGIFGPPSFEKTIFTFEKDKTLNCTPNYY